MTGKRHPYHLRPVMPKVHACCVFTDPSESDPQPCEHMSATIETIKEPCDCED